MKKKKIAVLVEDLYQELEVWYPALRFREAGHEVVLVGTGSKSEYKSKVGYPARVDTDVEKIKSKDFDAVIIPGGYAPDILRRYDKINAFVRDMDKSGKIVGAICHAGWVLVSAGILKGRKGTSFSAIKDDMIAAGMTWVDEEVVVDKNLITSRKPDDLPAFCRAILEKL